MKLLEPALGPLFVALAPPSDDLSFFSPVAQAYTILTAIVGVFGLAYLASGLAAARRFEDAIALRPLAVAMTLIAVVSSLFWILGLTLVAVDASRFMTVVSVIALLVNLFGTLARSYLFVISIVGWLSHEQPRIGWAVAALGTGLALLTQVLTPVIWVISSSQELLVLTTDLLGTAALAGSVLVVVAFATGLPSTVSVGDDAEPGPTGDPRAATPPGSGAG